MFDDHSPEKRGLCLMKRSSEMLQNLPYFWNTKTRVVFCFSFLATFFFPLINALVYVNIDQGSLGGKDEVARNEKLNCMGFCIFKNMANFEAFL